MKTSFNLISKLIIVFTLSGYYDLNAQDTIRVGTASDEQFNFFWTLGSDKSKDLSVPVKKGQKLIFEQTDHRGGHGLRILNPELVILEGDAAPKPDAVLRQLPGGAGVGASVPPIAEDGEPVLMAQFEAIKDVATPVNFNCVVHFGGMKGSVEAAQTSDVRVGTASDEQFNFFWTLGSDKSKDLSVPMKKGQKLIFEQTDHRGGHGLRILNPELVILEGDAAPKPDAVLRQLPGGAGVGASLPPIAENGDPVLMAQFEAIKDVATPVNFNCVVHFGGMKGRVVSPGSGIQSSTRVSSIEIIGGNDTGQWFVSIDGQAPVRQERIEVRSGDTIEWKVTGFGHGVVFTSESDAKGFLEIDEGVGQELARVQGFEFGANPWGNVRGFGGEPENPTTLVRGTVREGAANSLRFTCVVHGPDRMTASLLLVATPSGGTENDGRQIQNEIGACISKIPPSVHRRVLRMMNTARKPEDFSKSPQQIRVKHEHGQQDRQELQGPVAAAAAAASEKRVFHRGLAEDIIEGRPVNGYRDLAECNYQGHGIQLWKSELEALVSDAGPKRFGQWETVTSVGDPIMHASLTHTGKVVMFPSNMNTVIWDSKAPRTAPRIVPGAISGLGANLFCAGQSFLSDGRLLAVGGGGGGPGRSSSNQGWIFDPVTEKWRQTGVGPDGEGDPETMAFKRWYPTLVKLGHEPGQVLIVSGWQEREGPSTTAPQMEIYSEATDSFELVSATGPAGELLFRQTYPGLHLLPDGRVFAVPVGFGDCSQGPPNPRPILQPDPTAIFTFDPQTTSEGSWEVLEPNPRVKGMSVQLLDSSYPFVKVLAVGGGGFGTASTAQTINLSVANPEWDTPFPIQGPRFHPNAVVLPDGNVFICGGMAAGMGQPDPSGGPCEMFNPRTGTVAEMDELNQQRHYHSVAILLPTGQVMAAGGAGSDGCDVSRMETIEIFSPPYLFRGPRPEITGAEVLENVRHGTNFTIETPSPSAISKVVLVRPMAVTHQTDSEQRVIPLNFTVSGPKSIEARAPGGVPPNHMAPRGYYMLFILNHDRVPSVAKWIHLQ